MNNNLYRHGFCAALFLCWGSLAAAQGVQDYQIITELDSGDGHGFIMSNSEIGAIGENSSTSPPGSLPALPGGSERSVSAGITLDGDVAVTNGGTVTFSNSDVHAMDTGPANPGSQGVDCSASFTFCTDNGSQISSSNRFNQSMPAAAFSTLTDNNGIQGGFDQSALSADLRALQSFIDSTSATGSRDLSGAGGQVNNQANEVWDYSGDSFTGLNVIDIVTGGNDFSIENSNLTIKGDAGDFIIFRVDPSWVMHVSESNLLLDGGLGVNNVLFYVDADEGEESFNFDNVTFLGMALWDLDDGDVQNVISFNNVQYCGQLITDQVNLQNASGQHCAFADPRTVVPVPPAVWLFASALFGLIAVWRRPNVA